MAVSKPGFSLKCPTKVRKEGRRLRRLQEPKEEGRNGEQSNGFGVQREAITETGKTDCAG